MHTDGGRKASALRLPIYGPDNVARACVFGLSKLKTMNPLQHIAQINGEPGIVSYVEGRS
jgi:RNA polymerase sigma-70 factor, ECF subfamily